MTRSGDGASHGSALAWLTGHVGAPEVQYLQCGAEYCVAHSVVSVLSFLGDRTGSSLVAATSVPVCRRLRAFGFATMTNASHDSGGRKRSPCVTCGRTCSTATGGHAWLRHRRPAPSSRSIWPGAGVPFLIPPCCAALPRPNRRPHSRRYHGPHIQVCRSDPSVPITARPLPACGTRRGRRCVLVWIAATRLNTTRQCRQLDGCGGYLERWLHVRSRVCGVVGPGQIVTARPAEALWKRSHAPKQWRVSGTSVCDLYEVYTITDRRRATRNCSPTFVI